MVRKSVLKIMTVLVLAAILPLRLNVLPAAASPVNVNTYVNAQRQRETSIAVNPTKPDNIVIGFNDYSTGSCRPSYVYTINDGSAWNYGGSLPQGSLSDAPFCDPWLAFDSSGHLYYVALSHSTGHEIFVCVARPDGSGNVGPLGFGNPQIVDNGLSGENDKPAIAVDTTGGTHDGNIYVVWSHKAGSGYFKIWFRRGTRTGPTAITWSEPGFQVSPSSALYTQGAQVAVGPNGEVYVVHVKMTTSNIPTANAILFSRSLNGGAPGTWTTGTVVSSVNSVDWYVDNTNDGARHASFPTLGVSPKTGTIFVAWADDRNGDDDVLLSKSTDNGTNWLAVPKRVNNDAVGNGKDQFHPALTVNQGGAVDVIFYDRRDDPANKLFNLYLARSTDEGQNWPNYIITSQVTDPDVFSESGGGLGDYIGIASERVSLTTDRTFMAWADARVGKTSPRDYNTDIFFDTRDMLAIHSYIMIHAKLQKVISCVPLWRCLIKIPIKLLSIHNFNDEVSLTASGVPLGAEYYFDVDSGVPPFDAVLYIETNQGVEEGTFEVAITARGGEQTATQTVEVVLTNKPYILLNTLMVNPGHIVALQGQGFTADSVFHVFFDGERVQSGEVNEDGMISTEIEVPIKTPDGSHTIEVRDEEGVETSATLSTPLMEEEEEEKPTIESCNLTGVSQNTFDLTETVYVTGNDYALTTTYDIYIVNDTAIWTDGMTIPPRISGTATTVSSNSIGKIPPTAVWNNPLTIGKYDILIDVDGNGRYDEEVDILDDYEIEETAGFIVIPEFPSLIVMSLFMTATVLAAIAYRRKRLARHTKDGQLRQITRKRLIRIR